MSPVSAESVVVARGVGSLVGTRWRPASPSQGEVLLLHGGGQTRHAWSTTAGMLAATGWTATAMDARGHGESDWFADYSLDAFVADLRAVLGVGEAPSILVGASLGGITAMAVAGERPALVRGLVLVDVTVDVEDEGVDRIRAFMAQRPDGYASLDEAAAAISAFNPQRRPPRSSSGLRRNLRQGADGRWRWHWDPAFLVFGDRAARRARASRLREAAARVTAPTLIVRGLRSDVVSERGIADTRRLIPHAEVVDVAAGHMIVGDDNGAFGATLEDFLHRCTV
jgi:pimeloyl-ACP methyl ester carboxylesterase